MDIKKLLVGGAAGVMLSMQAVASPINVGGVVWDPDVFTDLTVGVSTMYEDAIGQFGVLNGYGEIKELNGTDQSVFCPGCELTFEFGGYQNTGITLDGGTGDLVFTGGWLNVYVDHTPDFDPNAPDGSQANDGVLFLTLQGHTDVDVRSLDDPALRFGTLFGGVTNLGSGADAGSGKGLMDVVTASFVGNPELGNVGIANGNFDTNTLSDNLGLLPQGVTGFADLNFSTSYNQIPGGRVTGDGMELTGSATIVGNTIPEPGVLGLLGLGILGLGVSQRRRRTVPSA